MYIKVWQSPMEVNQLGIVVQGSMYFVVHAILVVIFVSVCVLPVLIGSTNKGES